MYYPYKKVLKTVTFVCIDLDMFRKINGKYFKVNT